MGSDLASFEVPLNPEDAAAIVVDTGPQVRGWVYALLGASDPALAREVHNAAGPRPFACSGLIGPRGIQPWIGRLVAGEAYCLRLCALTARVAAALEAALSRALAGDGVIRLGPAALRMARPPTVVQSSYRRLAESPPRSRWRLDFRSPTAFRQRVGHLPLPLPDLIVRSAADRWNAFCPDALRLDAGLLQTAEEALFPSQVDIRSRRVRLEHGAFVGFIGSAEFTPVGSLPVAATAQLGALFAYACYCGLGHGTTRGWGQVASRG
jgi:hypothetical protein